jgi:hypothetical protein
VRSATEVGLVLDEANRAATNWDCAIKWFGLENETEDQKWKTLSDFDRILRTSYPK